MKVHTSQKVWKPKNRVTGAEQSWRSQGRSRSRGRKAVSTTSIGNGSEADEVAEVTDWL